MHEHVGKDQRPGKNLCLYLNACISIPSYVMMFGSRDSHLLLLATVSNSPGCFVKEERKYEEKERPSRMPISSTIDRPTILLIRSCLDPSDLKIL